MLFRSSLGLTCGSGQGTTMKGNDLQILATIWMNFTINEMSNTKESTLCGSIYQKNKQNLFLLSNIWVAFSLESGDKVRALKGAGNSLFLHLGLVNL